MKIYKYFLLLFLMGCTPMQFTPSDLVGAHNNNTFIELEKFPDPDDYGDIERDNAALDEYVNAVNWYLMISFSRAKTINEYALSRGWKPPETSPLCKLVMWPTLDELPKFKSKYQNDSNKFKWELTNHIRKVQDKYIEAVREYDDTLAKQLEQCLY